MREGLARQPLYRGHACRGCCLLGVVCFIPGEQVRQDFTRMMPCTQGQKPALESVDDRDLVLGDAVDICRGDKVQMNLAVLKASVFKVTTTQQEQVSLPSIIRGRCKITETLLALTLKGLSHEIDVKNFDKNLQNLA
jgi:hypothetical protein